MNFRVIFQIFGRVSVLVGVLMCLPMILSACLGESCWWAFAIAIAIAVAVGVPVVVLCKPKSKRSFPKRVLFSFPFPGFGFRLWVRFPL